jgi:hypothetical protein
MRFLRFAVLSALVLLPLWAWAQAGTTSLRGTIMDAKGAVIAGAEVTLSNPATGFSRVVKTNNSGEYVFAQLPPATYVLTATAPGFGRSRAANLVLAVNQPATLNLTLSVKVQETIIEVTATAPLVNTTDATVGNAFNSEQLINLPSEGRDPVAILSLQPGVVYLGNNVSQVGTSLLVADSRGGSVSGARSDQTNVTLDGLDNNDQLLGLAFEGALRTTLDSLQEFRVTTTNANADQGRSSGAQVNLITKSGTNKFHGTLYEYHRPTFTAANDWFIKHSQLKAGQPNVPLKTLRNTFGASVGGPIIKDRFFFFAAYEGQRRSEAAQVTRTIPSDTLRAGILQYPCDTGDPLCSLANPMVRDVNGTLVTTLMPADIAAMDPTCATVTLAHPVVTCPNGAGPNPAVQLSWTPYPSPNSDAVGDLFNFRGSTFAGPNPGKTDTYILKLDYKLTSSGNHTLFVRGNLQNDYERTPPQFPGQPANAFLTNNSKGIAVGYTALLSPHLVNNFRYAFVRQGTGVAGITTGGAVVNFRGLDEPSPLFERTSLVNVPVHNFVNDTSWTKGKHTIQFGANWRFVTNNRLSDGSNVSSAVTNAFWLVPAGIANTGTDLDPAVFGFPAVDPGFGISYDFAAMALTGILSENNVNFSNDKTGTTITPGALIPRHFKSYEAEFYVQDTWRITPSLTLTGGIRYALLQPIYERTGNQVCPTTSLHNWFQRRGVAAAQGIVDQPTISLDLCGKANGRSSYWGWDYKDIGPRFAVAWSPNSDHGILKAIFGTGGKGSLRAGYGIYYDHFGQGIANTFDRTGSFGLTTVVTNPASVQDVSCAPRFSAPGVLPAGTFCGQNLSPASPIAGGYPVTPPTLFNDGSFAIYWGLDDKLKTPYAHVFNLSYERELPGNFVVSATYQGRLGRRLLQEVDLAQPLNLVDPASGMSYYQAASAFSALAEAGTPITSVQPIPYWENLFPTASGANLLSGNLAGTIPCTPQGTWVAGQSLTATQNMYDSFGCFLHNETVALLIFDLFNYPAFLNGQPFQYFDDQFSSLYAWQSQGTSSYHALQFTLRHPMAKGLQFDLNYTYSKSIDAGSAAERVSLFEGFGFSGQVLNAWQPKQLRAPSDFDLRHQINANWIYELPFGQKRHWGAGWKGPAEAVLGGWQVSGLGRWTSGFPFFIFAGEGWATNWELQGSSIQIGDPGSTGTFIDSGGDPNIFKDPTQALTAFRGTRPGESGQRNNLRGPGYFGIDLGVAKKWDLGESRSLRFSWETFNLTNSVRFDAAQAASSGGFALTTSTIFGKYINTLTKPRVIQFALRFTF